ncbi:hypothetical protein [Elizabethkingia miricola]|uniref:Uncharacterized protein n=1 Tax=Elizabethkingia miricola TaxID=172045 RepID=A0ABD5B583_ELIMR|nr:hypothetical protein [Elizabethkingia miricola]MDQ8748593.1 hypothetical protein [Elizabethkingia miricola]OPB88218.1 hypothetical protein BAS06_13685 [Elizabethkingia miricola]QHQ85845.1 hypothetical protein FE632_03165 [Elizabethkingia miricola]UIO97089.1 hypothetical protein LYZ41_03175 [Elizabethkingia miricola]
MYFQNVVCTYYKIGSDSLYSILDNVIINHLDKESRLVVAVNVNKNPFSQLNYGTGKDVSTETLKDAGEPLLIKWYTDSYVKIPVLK